jgi:hypothetical protein
VFDADQECISNPVNEGLMVEVALSNLIARQSVFGMELTNKLNSTSGTLLQYINRKGNTLDGFDKAIPSSTTLVSGSLFISPDSG